MIHNTKHYYFNKKELWFPTQTIYPFIADPRNVISWVWQWIGNCFSKLLTITRLCSSEIQQLSETETERLLRNKNRIVIRILRNYKAAAKNTTRRHQNTHPHLFKHDEEVKKKGGKKNNKKRRISEWLHFTWARWSIHLNQFHSPRRRKRYIPPKDRNILQLQEAQTQNNTSKKRSSRLLCTYIAALSSISASWFRLHFALQ